jgi:hypothetical protein
MPFRIETLGKMHFVVNSKTGEPDSETYLSLQKARVRKMVLENAESEPEMEKERMRKYRERQAQRDARVAKEPLEALSDPQLTDKLNGLILESGNILPKQKVYLKRAERISEINRLQSEMKADREEFSAGGGSYKYPGDHRPRRQP